MEDPRQDALEICSIINSVFNNRPNRSPLTQSLDTHPFVLFLAFFSLIAFTLLVLWRIKFDVEWQEYITVYTIHSRSVRLSNIAV